MLIAGHSATWDPDALAGRLPWTEELSALAPKNESEFGFWAHTWRGVNALEQNDIDEFERQTHHCTRIADQTRQPFWLHYAAIWRAAAALERGRLSEAERLADDALAIGSRTLAIGQQAQDPNAGLFHGLQMFAIRHAQGRVGELREQIEALAEQVPFYAFFLAPVIIADGDRERGNALMERLMAMHAEAPFDLMWLPCTALLAELVAWLGDAERASAFHAMLLPYRDRALNIGGLATLGPASRWLDRIAASDGNVARFDGARPSDGAASMVRDGDDWTFTFAGRGARVRDSKGVGDLARLLRSPWTDMHVGDLVGLIATAGDGSVIDAEARARYRDRVRDLEEERAEAEAAADDERAAGCREEIDALVAELSGAYGLRGRARDAKDPIERARKAVAWRINQALSRIERAHPPLGRHLRRSIRTGTFCAYRPDEPVAWRIA